MSWGNNSNNEEPEQEDKGDTYELISHDGTKLATYTGVYGTDYTVEGGNVVATLDDDNDLHIAIVHLAAGCQIKRVQNNT